MTWSESPRPTSRLIPRLAAVLFAVGALLYLAGASLPYPAASQTVGVVALCAAICLIARHQEHFTYVLEPDIRGTNGTDLVVKQRKNRREITVCRLGLEDVREIDEQNEQNAQVLKEKYQADRVHSYCVDILPKQSAYLVFDDGGDRVVIRLQCSDELLAMVRAALPPQT